MYKMIEAFAAINERRQSEGKKVTALTMFAEAWEYNKAEMAILSFDNHMLECKIQDLDAELKLLRGDD